MKISTRLNSRVTSIQVKDSICALHYLYMGGQMPPTSNSVRDHVLDTCHDIISQWEGSGRGLSGHITDCMLNEVIKGDDEEDYSTILGLISK